MRIEDRLWSLLPLSWNMKRYSLAFTAPACEGGGPGKAWHLRRKLDYDKYKQWYLATNYKFMERCVEHGAYCGISFFTWNISKQVHMLKQFRDWNRKNSGVHLRFWIYHGPLTFVRPVEARKLFMTLRQVLNTSPIMVGHLRHRSFPWSLKVSILTPKTRSCLEIRFTLAM